MVDAWPRDERLDRRRFELLKRAYVEARYSESYVITTVDLETLGRAVWKLREIVVLVCAERLDALREAAAV